MSIKVVKSTVFIICLMAITVSSVIPYAKNDGMLSLKLTESGMVVHFIAYLVAAVLFYWAYGKKEDSGRRTELRHRERQRSDVRSRKANV